MTAIRDEIDAEASARGVWDKLYKRQEAGEFRDRDGRELDLPSVRTIQDIRRDWARDDSGPWQLTDSAPADIRIVLNVLASVIERSEGRIRFLTKQEAALIPSLHHAGEGRLSPWIVFRLARFYIHWTARESDQDLVTYLAFIANPQRLRRNAEKHWISERRMLEEILSWAETSDA